MSESQALLQRLLAETANEKLLKRKHESQENNNQLVDLNHQSKLNGVNNSINSSNFTSQSAKLQKNDPRLMLKISDIDPLRFLNDEDPLLKIKESLSSGSFPSEVLNDLVDTPLEDLRKKPSELDLELSSIRDSFARYIFNEYKVFLNASACNSLAISTATDITETLKTSLPLDEIKENLNKFSHQAKEVIKERDMAISTLQCHDSILELLEIPQLMETLVINNNFVEAINLHNFVRRLSTRLPNNEIISLIVQEVEKFECTMFIKLIQLLEIECKLPLCIKIIGFLRKMDIISELELRIIFLQKRNEYVKARLNKVADFDPYKGLKAYLDTFRDTVFEVISQYTTLFPTKSSKKTSANTSVNSNSSEKNEHLSKHMRGRSNSINSREWTKNRALSNIQYNFDIDSLTQKILVSYTEFVSDLLEKRLIKSLTTAWDPTQVASLYTQCIYLSNSFSRLGLELNAHVFTLFNDALLTNIEGVVSNGIHELKVWLNDSINNLKSNNQSFRSQALNSFLKALYKNNKLSVDEIVHQDDESNDELSNGQVVSAPLKLVDYPVLAFILNIFFTSFNQIRMLPLPDVEPLLNNFITSKLGDIRKSFDLVLNKYVIPHKDTIININPDSISINQDSSYGLYAVDMFFEAFDTMLTPNLTNAVSRLFVKN